MSLSSRCLRAAGALSALGLLAACTPSTPSTAGAANSAAAEPDLIAGKKTFTLICATCHQANGAGVPGVFPPLAGSPLLAEADPGKLIRIVLHGLQGPIEVKGQAYNAVMPAQGGQLKDAEIANVLSYVRAAWGGDAPPVTAEAVAAVRAAVKRDTPWTWADLHQP